MKIAPIRLSGVWRDGYALDKHTFSSTYIGKDEYGHNRYSNEYSEAGTAMNQLKYHQQYQYAKNLADAAAKFIKNKWKISIGLIIPVPPTNHREVQPVFRIVEELGKNLNTYICNEFLTKLNKIQVKNLDHEQKKNLLKNNIYRNKILKFKVNVLVVDDLYDSGATLTAVCNELKNDPNLNDVYVLTMTKTRKG